MRNCISLFLLLSMKIYATLDNRLPPYEMKFIVYGEPRFNQEFMLVIKIKSLMDSVHETEIEIGLNQHYLQQ